MSTRSTVELAQAFHLYTDFLDPYDGPHGYLSIEKGLVKEIRVEQANDGLIVTIRLPAEVFPILRADIAKELRSRGRPLSPRQLSQGLERLRALAGRKKRPASAAPTAKPRGRVRS